MGDLGGWVYGGGDLPVNLTFRNAFVPTTNYILDSILSEYSTTLAQTIADSPHVKQSINQSMGLQNGCLNNFLSSARRQEAYDYLWGMVAAYPNLLYKPNVIDTAGDSYSGWIRLQLYINPVESIEDKRLRSRPR